MTKRLRIPPHSAILNGSAGFLIALILLLIPIRAGAAIEVIDDNGQPVRLERQASRVISLYGSFSEMLYAIGAGGTLIARTQADQFPKAIEKLPAVGTHMRPNVEMILGFKPDLVLVSATRRDDIPELERIRSAGVQMAVFSPGGFEEIFSVMKRLSVLTGSEEGATRAIAALRARLESVRANVQGVEPRRVFFEVRTEPLTGAGKGSMAHAVLTAAGAKNVLELEKPIVQFSVETLLMSNPDVYIVQSGPMNRNPIPPRERPHFSRLSAVMENRVLTVDEFTYSRPGPRCVDAVEELAAKLYGRGGTPSPEDSK